jgi:hypothetical protein
MAMMAAADPNCAAAATAESFAAFVSFQRQYASLPPSHNVNSVALAEPAAAQFGGSIAICAELAAITATFTTVRL